MQSNSLQADVSNLRRSTRKRKVVTHDDYTDSSGYEDEDLMVRCYNNAISMNANYSIASNFKTNALNWDMIILFD